MNALLVEPSDAAKQSPRQSEVARQIRRRSPARGLGLFALVLAVGASACATETGGESGTVATASIRRMSNAEYDSTMRDLLGVSSTPAHTFIGDQSETAAAGAMTDAQFEQYFDAADELVERAFADSTLKAKIMTCTPASGADAACITQIISAFGQRAWGRPLQDAEVLRLAETASDAIALGEETTGAMKHVAKAMLSSADFLYRADR